jgi:hypothetical protein
VSDLEHSEIVSLRDDDDVSPRGVREGLPQGFRMRADAHYVDQLASRHEERVIRLIPINEIEAVGSPGAVGKPLAASISTLGILQPLLVRKHKLGYRVIAGRRRLAAAAQAGLREVPCLVYDADETKAAALAEADNLREQTAPDPLPVSTKVERLRSVLRAVSTELAPLNSSASLLKRAASHSLQHRVAADLMVAQAWRASWLANAAGTALGDPIRSRPRLLPAIFDSVRMGFEAEMRVSALQLKFSVAPDAANIPVGEEAGVLAIAGGVFATLALLESVDEPQVEVHADMPNARTLKIEIVQRMVPLSADGLRNFRDASVLGSGDLMTALGLQAMRAFAAEHGGTFEASAMNGRGSLIQATVVKR